MDFQLRYSCIDDNKKPARRNPISRSTKAKKIPNIISAVFVFKMEIVLAGLFIRIVPTGIISVKEDIRLFVK